MNKQINENVNCVCISVLLLAKFCFVKQKVLCDYTLEADGTEICVHRAVMVACSDYFRAMLTGSMKESTEQRSTLQGVTADGLTAIVQFAYTGKLELTLDNLEEVLSAASYLQVNGSRMI